VFVLGTLAAIGACAEGSAPATATEFEPTKTTEPTEPEKENLTVPPPKESSSGEEEASSGSSGTPESSSGTSGASGAPQSRSGASGTSGKPDSGAPDAGSCGKVAPSNVCGLTPQCGCAPNETCDVTDKSNGAVSCILAGGGPQGSLCTTSSQCAI